MGIEHAPTVGYVIIPRLFMASYERPTPYISYIVAVRSIQRLENKAMFCKAYPRSPVTDCLPSECRNIFVSRHTLYHSLSDENTSPSTLSSYLDTDYALIHSLLHSLIVV